MNEAPQLELVDLGDAKEETKGEVRNNRLEENSVIYYRF